MHFTFKEACRGLADLYEAIPETFCTGNFAKDAAGNPVSIDNPAACSWCTFGGLMVTVPVQSARPLHRIARKLGFISGFRANDIGGRQVAITILRIVSGELPMPKEKK